MPAINERGLAQVLKGLAVSFVIIAVLTQVLGTIRDGFTADTYEYNITNAFVVALDNARTYAGIFVIVVFAAYVLQFLGLLG